MPKPLLLAPLIKPAFTGGLKKFAIGTGASLSARVIGDAISGVRSCRNGYREAVNHVNHTINIEITNNFDGVDQVALVQNVESIQGDLNAFENHCNDLITLLERTMAEANQRQQSSLNRAQNLPGPRGR